MNVGIAYECIVRYRASKNRQFLWLTEAGFIPCILENMNLSSLKNRLCFARSKGQFIKSLFRELLNDLPLGFHLERRVPHTASLPLEISRLFWFTSVVSSCNLSLPLLLFFSLLWACEVCLEVCFVLLLLNLLLLSLGLSLLGRVDSLFVLL